jgi:nucleotide-binding universal stress UspA family protein
MTTRILVPLDGSPLSDRVLAQVRRVLHREDAQVVLLHVITDEAAARLYPPGENGLVLARKHVEKLRDELVAQGAQAESRVVTGDPAARILEIADEIGADLIAMTTHGRTGLDRFVRGSVAERVLRHTSRPLLLVNPHTRAEGELELERILVPLDGSELAGEILPLVATLARLYDAEVVLLYAIELAVVLDPMVAALPVLTPADAETLLAPFKKRLPGIKTRTRIAMGPPAASIVEAIREEKASLVAMTTHGRAGLSRWFFGSVAEQVVRNTSCPLLVKRRTSPA